MVVSRDLQEVSVLECILGGLHIGVDVESEPERARTKLAKSKIDALIIDFDLVRRNRLPERIAGWRHPECRAAHHRQRLRRPEAPGVQGRFVRISKTNLGGAGGPHSVRGAKHDSG